MGTPTLMAEAAEGGHKSLWSHPGGQPLCSPSQAMCRLEFVPRSLFLQDLDLPWTTARHDTPPMARGAQRSPAPCRPALVPRTLQSAMLGIRVPREDHPAGNELSVEARGCPWRLGRVVKLGETRLLTDGQQGCLWTRSLRAQWSSYHERKKRVRPEVL